MKQIAFRWMIVSSLLLALVALFAPWAMADDETDKVKIEVEATLEAVDCLAIPPTIMVLGLNIDISQASIEGEDHDDGDDNDDDLSKHSDDDNLTCAALLPGQRVEVKLASDIPDPSTGLLSATEVEIEDGDCEEDHDFEEVKVAGPIQAVDQIGQTVTVLGLVIDISQAKLESDDDEDEDNDELASQSHDDDDNDGDDPPVDISQLIVGQFVEIKLVSSEAPLVATELEVKNFDNEVDVDVEDDDGDVNDDVEIDVAVTVLVAKPAKQAARNPGALKMVKKELKFHTVGNGGASLKGLPTGKAKIVVTRIKDGRKSVGRSAVKVERNGTKQVRVRLKRAR